MGTGTGRLALLLQAQGFGFRVWGLGVQGLRVQGSGFRVEGLV